MALPRHETDSAVHMDGIYRYQRHIYDITRKCYLLGRDRLLDDLNPPARGRVLEVACGTGRNLICAARKYPDAAFYGFDVSEEMLATARRSIERAGLTRRITLASGDASDFTAAGLFAIADFDRVFVSYAVSMIPPWRDALECAFAAVAPGGELHVVDFGQQSRLPNWFHDGLAAWLSRFDVTPRADLENELARIAPINPSTLTFTQLYRDYARYAVIRKPALGSSGQV